jgi:hypothetical protein
VELAELFAVARSTVYRAIKVRRRPRPEHRPRLNGDEHRSGQFGTLRAHAGDQELN